MIQVKLGPIVGLSGCSCPPGAATLKRKSPPAFNHFRVRAPLILWLLWDFNGNGVFYTTAAVKKHSLRDVFIESPLGWASL